MASFRRVLTFATDEPEAVLNITAACVDAVAASGIQDGLALVFPLHTSSCVFISDSDPGIAEDYRELAARLVPTGAGYRHDEIDHKRNAHGHLISILTGHHVCCPVSDGRFEFGAYHTIYYLELDGRRPKEVLIKVVGDPA